MAKRTVIIDDLTGEAGARTRTFALDGVEYEIDLSDPSYADLRAALKPYVRAARPVSGAVAGAGRRAAAPPTPAPRRRPGSKPAPESAAIRAWARSVGMGVTERGRVPADVRAAWQAAGSPA